ncbi:MAG: hypothetical protein GXP54_03650 [Deltaproteobacteria bacterium]|nr:hypothetical protein [Deltaproteobacteria bacterium]
MKILMTALISLMFLAVNCGVKPCGDLQDKVCAKAPGTVACKNASRLTNNDECQGYLKNVDEYVKLSNLVVDKPGVKPPAPAVKTPAPTPEKAVEPTSENQSGQASVGQKPGENQVGEKQMDEKPTVQKSGTQKSGTRANAAPAAPAAPGPSDKKKTE